jgi:hypothetical protein
MPAQGSRVMRQIKAHSKYLQYIKENILIIIRDAPDTYLAGYRISGRICGKAGYRISGRLFGSTQR